MRTELYWISGPWPGKLGIAARPRGGDWLRDEMLNWGRAGVNTVLSLLTRDEEHDLELDRESREALSAGMEFLALPIPDRQIPISENAVTTVLTKLDAELSAGKNVIIYCRQGIGRSGLLAACLLVIRGWDPETAVRALSGARGIQIPETREQRDWIDYYAATLATAK